MKGICHLQESGIVLVTFIIICIKFHLNNRINFPVCLSGCLSVVLMGIILILILCLFLADELCHGQRSSRRGRGMGRGRGRRFSCTDCREESMYDPYVCQSCYKGADDNGPFKCRGCEVGSRSQPFVCQKCNLKGIRFQKIFIITSVVNVFNIKMTTVPPPVLLLLLLRRQRPAQVIFGIFYIY